MTNELKCKIADFELATNERYQYSPRPIFRSLIPPECGRNGYQFTKKGDVYFYGWLIHEVFFGHTPKRSNLNELMTILKEKEGEHENMKLIKSIIIQCLDIVTIFNILPKLILFFLES